MCTKFSKFSNLAAALTLKKNHKNTTNRRNIIFEYKKVDTRASDQPYGDVKNFKMAAIKK